MFLAEVTRFCRPRKRFSVSFRSNEERSYSKFYNCWMMQVWARSTYFWRFMVCSFLRASRKAGSVGLDNALSNNFLLRLSEMKMERVQAKKNAVLMLSRNCVTFRVPDAGQLPSKISF